MPRGSSRTAEAVCFFRAVETAAPAATRALVDPWARHFLSPARRASVDACASAVGQMMYGRVRPIAWLHNFVVARHRFIDDALTLALDGGSRRLVVLGAGYDSRGHRFASALDQPALELDYGPTQAEKMRLVDQAPLPASNVTYLAVDFMRDSLRGVLATQGTVRRAFIVWEGVTMYLDEGAIRATLLDLRAAVDAGSELTCDWFSRPPRGLAALATGAASRSLALLGEPFRSSYAPAEARALLARCGWQVVDLADPPEMTRRVFGTKRQILPWCFVLRCVAV